MKINEIRSLPPEQIQEMLHEELGKERKNDKVILMLLEVLEEQDTGGCASKQGEAWQLFVKRYHTKMTAEDASQRNRWRRRLGIMAASVAIFLVGVFGVPKVAGYDNIFELVASWTDDFLVLSNSDDAPGQLEYVFETDNPGLQQVYDAVVEIGITDPVVPMWLPDGYELVELKGSSASDHKKVYARFTCDKNQITLSYKLYYDHQPSKLPKEDAVELYEHNGVTYSMFCNEKNWTAVWNAESAICVLSVGENKNILQEAINTIY